MFVSVDDIEEAVETKDESAEVEEVKPKRWATWWSLFKRMFTKQK
jgi:hypothetical protein